MKKLQQSWITSFSLVITYSFSGNVERSFESIEDKVVESDEFQQLLYNVAQMCNLNMENLHIAAHQVREESGSWESLLISQIEDIVQVRRGKIEGITEGGVERRTKSG